MYLERYTEVSMLLQSNLKNILKKYIRSVAQLWRTKVWHCSKLNF